VRLFHTYITVFLILSANSFALSQTARSDINDGNHLYKDQKYADAEAAYRKSLDKDKQIMQGYFDLGDALYKQQRYDEAVQSYENALEKTTDPKIGAHLYHNIGNANLEKKNYQESIDDYKRSLRLNPDDEDTKYNLAYAEKMLKQQQQQKKENKNDKNQKNNQDQKNKQDQQKQQQQNQKNQQQNQQDRKQQQQKQQQQQQQDKQMSRAEAQRILDALKNDEKEVQKKLRRKAVVRGDVVKDW